MNQASASASVSITVPTSVGLETTGLMSVHTEGEGVRIRVGRMSASARLRQIPGIWIFYLSVSVHVMGGCLFLTFVSPGLFLTSILGGQGMIRISPVLNASGGAIALTVVFIIMWIHSFTMHWIVACSDSGALPRGNIEEPEQKINGNPVAMKWCYTCRIWRPPRTVHCRQCNACILAFDHHCPYVGNCIGQNNYRFFLMFLLDACIVSAYVTAVTIAFLATLIQQYSEFSTAFNAFGVWIAGSMATCVVAGLLFLNVFALASYHLGLASTSKTTYENQTNCFGATPYATSCPENWFRSFCPPAYAIVISSDELEPYKEVEMIP